MYDPQQFKNLQSKSHVRGLLSKQFYSLQQNQLQRKRKQMKQMLDQQVQQRRRQKERLKFEQDRKQKKEQQEIKRYYVNLQHRSHDQRQKESESKRDVYNTKLPKATLNNDPRALRNEHYDTLANQTFPKERSRIRTNQRQQRGSNMPVMVLQMEAIGAGWNIRNIQNRNSPNLPQHAQDFHNSSNPNVIAKYRNISSGNIPLLDLAGERNVNYNGSNHMEQSQTNQSLRNGDQYSTKRKKQRSPNRNHQLNPKISQMQANFHQNNQLSVPYQANSKMPQSPNNSQYQNANYNPYNSFSPSNFMANQSRKLQDNQINVFAPQQEVNSRRNTENRQFVNDMAASRHQKIQPQLQNENKVLKSELKKSQQAISLLIGAMRSNNRLDKFRIQAQKILHGNATLDNQKQSRAINGMQTNQSDQKLMLPKLNLRNQSIMHDYMFGAARKANKSKTQKLQKAGLAIVQESNLRNIQSDSRIRQRK